MVSTQVLQQSGIRTFRASMHKCLFVREVLSAVCMAKCRSQGQHYAAGEPYWKAAGIEDKIKLHIGAANDTLVELLAVRRTTADVTCLR